MGRQLSFNEALNALKGTDRGQEALGKVSPGEIGWGIAGGLAGLTGGYLLARLLHRDPSKKRRFMYAILGALLGVGGAQAALSKLPGGEGFAGSLRDKLRVSSIYNEPTGGGEGEQGKPGKSWLSRMFSWDRAKDTMLPGKANTIAAGLGGYAGWKGYGIDFTGTRGAQAALDNYNKSNPELAVIKKVRNVNNGRLTFDNASQKAQALIRQHGARLKDGTSLELARPDGVARRDNAINAGANAALAYALMSTANYIAQTHNAGAPKYRPELDIRNILAK